MNRKVPAMAAIAAAVVCVACGRANVEQVDAAATRTVVASSTTETPAPTPNSDELAAKQDADVDDFYERLEAWVASDLVQSLDPKSLRQSESMRDPSQGYASLAEAVDHADLAVLGTVVETQFVSRGALLTTFRVERVAKGPAQDTVTINQIGLTLAPSYDQDTGPDWNSANPTLGKTPASPPIFVGDRALLLLEKAGEDGDRYYIQNYSGQYRSTNGRVKTLPACEFHDVDGLTERALLDRIEAHAMQDRPAGPTTQPG